MRSNLAPLVVTAHGSPRARLPTAVIDAALELLDRSFGGSENGDKSCSNSTQLSKDQQSCFDVTVPSSLLSHVAVIGGEIADDVETGAISRSISSESTSNASEGCANLLIRPVDTGRKVVSAGEKNDYNGFTLEEKINRRRAQNRAAAVKCRLKKQQKYQQLLTTIRKLECQNRCMHDQITELKSTLTALEAEASIHSHCPSGLMYFRQPTKAMENFPAVLVRAAQ